jgi:hypothetical protein
MLLIKIKHCSHHVTGIEVKYLESGGVHITLPFAEKTMVVEETKVVEETNDLPFLKFRSLTTKELMDAQEKFYAENSIVYHHLAFRVKRQEAVTVTYGEEETKVIHTEEETKASLLPPLKLKRLHCKIKSLGERLYSYVTSLRIL